MSPTNPSPFGSLEELGAQFNQGLHQLLDAGQLSTFILVLANATQHEDLFDEFRPKLQQQYDQLVSQFRQRLLHGDQLDEVDEDLLVFLKLHTIGFDSVKTSQQRREGHYNCQFNHIRSFRPRRISSFHNDNEITAPYDEYTFNFNKPFMAKECFWRGELHGKQIDLFYNKYPFAELHGLCVPEREQCHPQLLTERMHDYMWHTTEQLAHTLPGVGFGYNSYGAYASVNHLHFQMFVDPDGLPITDDHWQHNNGKFSYPLNVIKHTDKNHAWQALYELHQQRQPYNLLYTPGEIYIISRKVQGSVEVPVWSSGFTWYELCGAMLMFNQQDFAVMHQSEIEAKLAACSV